MAELTPITELEAVNEMLMSIGQRPVNTLLASGIRDVNIAQNILHSVSRSVQQKGWSFNQERNVTFTPDFDTDEIELPTDILFADPSDRCKDIVVRQGKLYDRVNRTYSFSEPVELDVITFLAFEDITQHARDYIALRAARKFQTQAVGARLLYEYTSEEETLALVEFKRAENKKKDINMTAGSWQAYNITGGSRRRRR